MDNPRLRLIGVLAFVVMFAAHFGIALSFPYTNWDDQQAFVQNPFIAQPTAESLRRIWTPGEIPAEQLFIPLSYSSFWLESKLVGMHAPLSHSLNLLLHFACCALAFCLLKRLGVRDIPAYLATMIVAFHPLQVEAVVWVTGRKDLLAALFGFLSLHVFLLSRDRGRPWLGALVCVCFALSLLAKPSLILLPFMLVVLLMKRGVRPRPGEWVTIGCCVILSGLCYWVSSRYGGTAPADAPTVAHRVLCMPVLVSDFLFRFAAMRGLSPIYQWPDVDLLFWLKLVSAVMVGLALLVLCLRKRSFTWPRMLAGLAFAPAFAVLLHYREFFTGDRYGYVAMIGVAWLVVKLGTYLYARMPRFVTVAAIAWLLLMLLAGRLTVNTWQSSLSLWERAAQTAPGLSLVYNNMGSALLDAGKQKEAFRAYHHCIAIDPQNHKSWNNLANLHLALDEPEQAVAAAREAIRLNPAYPQALHNLGVAHLRLKQPEKALGAFRRSLNISVVRQNPYTIFLMGNAFEQIGEPEKAAVCYRQALRRAPTRANYRSEIIWRLDICESQK